LGWFAHFWDVDLLCFAGKSGFWSDALTCTVIGT